MTVQRYTLDVTDEQREAAKKEDFSWVRDYEALACHFGVWDEGLTPKSPRSEIILKTDRRNFCFFWKNRPGMLLPAAEILQKREAEEKEKRQDRRLTLYGLWIAAIALMIDALKDLKGCG